MTKAMKKKFENALRKLQNDHDGYYVNHACIFHHYGEDYRIAENATEYKVYRIHKTDACDTLIETIAK